MLKDKFAQILVVVAVMCCCTVNGQTVRSHHSYLCDEPGKFQGRRMQSALDFSLCKGRFGQVDYCKYCKCEWTRYWESASACFAEDSDLESRLLLERKEWNRDHAVYCLGISEEDATDTAYSLDENSNMYCSSTVRMQATMLWLALVLLCTQTIF